MAKQILMTEEDKQRWIGPLFEYYRQKEIPESKIQKIIDDVFTSAQIGWNRAPGDLDTRIKVKTGFQWKSHENLNPKRKEISMTEVNKTEEPIEDSSLVSHMTQNEQRWWEERTAVYKKDFDFNESSDKSLLEQLLVEELIQRRLFRLQLKYPERDYNKKLTDSLNRMAALQTNLGITRKQRAGILDNIEGNVAELALKLEDKLNKMPEIMKKDYEEELYYENLKKQRPPNNILPPIEKMEALLNVGGKLSANIDSDRISQITEEVAREITESKQKETQLPDGINIS